MGLPKGWFALEYLPALVNLFFCASIKRRNASLRSGAFESAMAIPAAMKMEEKSGVREFKAMDIHRLARSEIENGGNFTPRRDASENGKVNHCVSVLGN